MAYRLAQYGFSGGEWAPELFGRTDLEKYALALLRAKNCLISKPGSIVNRPGLEFVGEVRDSSKSTRIVPFQFNTVQTYVLEWGDEIMRPIMDAGQILQSSQNVVSITQASPGVVEITGHGWSNGDKVFPDAIGGMTELLDGRTFTVRNATTDTFTLEDMWGDAVDTSAYTAYTSGGTFSRLYQLAMPYDHTEIFDVGYDQTADTMLLAHLSYAPRKLTRAGHASWSVSTITFAPTLAAPTSPSATATVGSGATTYQYKITAIDEDTGEESLPSSVASVTNDLTTAGNKNTVSWTGSSGAERYIIYKADNGVYGLIGGTTGTSFVDENILPDLGDTPPAARNPFGSSNNYPCVVSFHQGRSGWGHTNNTPAGFWLSCSNLYYNMNVASPAKSDDAVSFDLRPGVNAINGVASLKKLVLLTADAEYTIEGSGVAKAITPSLPVVERHTARGAKRLRPIIIGDIALYVQRQGGAIRAFGYSFEKDGYRSNDLTLLAPHLFRGHTIVDWCYQQDPDSIVWCVRDDGVVLTLTFVEDQNTFAWTPVYLGGTFGSGASATGFGVAESCCCIEGEDQDDVYFVVKRTINGQTKRYIEKLAARWRASLNSDGDVTNIDEAQFLDSFVSGTAASSTATISNLWHLEGQTVDALVAGNVHRSKTVTNGAITLSSSMSTGDVYCVGLSYQSDIVDLPIAQGTDTGAPQGRLKGVSGIVVKFQNTRGVSFGLYGNEDRMCELAEAHFRDAWDDPIQPYSGDTLPLNPDGGWSLNGSIILRQAYPLPMEVLMIARDLTIGGP